MLCLAAEKAIPELAAQEKLQALGRRTKYWRKAKQWIRQFITLGKEPELELEQNEHNPEPELEREPVEMEAVSTL